MTRRIQVPNAPTAYIPHGKGMMRKPTAEIYTKVTRGVKRMKRLGNLVYRVPTIHPIQKDATMTACGSGI